MKKANLLQSFKCALAGVACIISTQRNMKIHLIAAAGVFALAWYFGFSRLEFAVLALTVGAVIIAEAINTAIETVVDLASPGFHPLAKRAKDIAAGAVLISAVMSVIIAYLLFWPRISG